MSRKDTHDLIKKHEGVSLITYADTVGHPTVGIGFNLDKKGACDRIKAVGADFEQVYAGNIALSEQQVHALFTVDLDDAFRTARILIANFEEHPEPIQSVIVDMIFNLGPVGFSKFVKTIAALENKDYCTAAAQMADSVWATQVPNRAKENIAIVMEFCKS